MDARTSSEFFYFTATGSDRSEQEAPASSRGDDKGQSERIETGLEWVQSLTFEELVFWAFKDSLSNIQWRYSLKELRQYTQIKVGELQVTALQNFEVMAKILSLAFGGGKKKETQIRNKDQLEAMLRKLKE